MWHCIEDMYNVLFGNSRVSKQDTRSLDRIVGWDSNEGKIIMKQLSGTDSLFVSMETNEVHSHIGGLVILDPSSNPRFSLERLTRTLAERLPLAGPEFTAKLQESPLGLSRPYLVKDENFDVSRHVHRIAVPSPGGMRELADLAGYLHSQKLDRGRPLWEMWFIEGLEDDKVAIYMKTHHALMDGMKGNDLSAILCDLEPEPTSRAAIPAIQPSEEAPSTLHQAWEDISNVAALPRRIATYGFQALRRGFNMASYVYENGTDTVPSSAPRLSFNGELSPHRAIACTSLPLDDVKAVKNAACVKMNDVALEICGSAMRKYAERNGEEIDGSLSVTCPVSTRAEDDKTSANKVASMMVSCATDVADPFDRLQAIHTNAMRAKELVARARETPIESIGEVLPPTFVNLGFRALGGLTELSGSLPSNATVSNVPGPPVQLYIAGAPVERIFPISVLATTQGLNFTLVSFLDRFDIGLTVDPEMIPDAWVLAECVDEAWQELRDAVLGPAADAKPTPMRPNTPGRFVLPERSIAAA